jgi:hypothetical protein
MSIAERLKKLKQEEDALRKERLAGEKELKEQKEAAKRQKLQQREMLSSHAGGSGGTRGRGGSSGGRSKGPSMDEKVNAWEQRHRERSWIVDAVARARRGKRGMSELFEELQWMQLSEEEQECLIDLRENVASDT